MRGRTNASYLRALAAYRLTHHRDVALLCEHRPERDYAVSTIWTSNGTAKALASQLDLIAAMCRAAVEGVTT